MHLFQKRCLFQVIEVMSNIFLMCLGGFFIYEADIINRFQLKRTNFAEYYESINERPTVMSWIEYLSGGMDTINTNFFIPISLYPSLVETGTHK